MHYAFFILCAILFFKLLSLLETDFQFMCDLTNPAKNKKVK
jgi:hypothetical protein